MPERKRIVKRASDEVQGEGSWVRVAQFTVREMREARLNATMGSGDVFELGVKVIQSHVVEWNWVDDNGNPFPQVPDNPDVVEELTDVEIGFLGRCITGSEADAKN